MSKAFTKEDDESGVIRLDDLPQSPHPNFVTPTGLAALHSRLAAQQAGLAALRHGAADIDTRHAIAVAERDIRFLNTRISSAILVKASAPRPGGVAFGAEVDFITEDEIRHSFRIVGEDEADPAQGLIAPFSPLGVALMGAELGDTVEWRKPNGSIEVEILAIRYPQT